MTVSLQPAILMLMSHPFRSSRIPLPCWDSVHLPAYFSLETNPKQANHRGPTPKPDYNPSTHLNQELGLYPPARFRLPFPSCPGERVDLVNEDD